MSGRALRATLTPAAPVPLPRVHPAQHVVRACCLPRFIPRLCMPCAPARASSGRAAAPTRRLLRQLHLTSCCMIWSPLREPPPPVGPASPYVRPRLLLMVSSPALLLAIPACAE